MDGEHGALAGTPMLSTRVSGTTVQTTVMPTGAVAQRRIRRSVILRRAS